MDDDFNTAGALGALFELARVANTFMAAHPAGLAAADLVALAQVEETLVELLGALGVAIAETSMSSFPPEVIDLAPSSPDTRARTRMLRSRRCWPRARGSYRAELGCGRCGARRPGRARLHHRGHAAGRTRDLPAGKLSDVSAVVEGRNAVLEALRAGVPLTGALRRGLRGRRRSTRSSASRQSAGSRSAPCRARCSTSEACAGRTRASWPRSRPSPTHPSSRCSRGRRASREPHRRARSHHG
jgi:hypothetical protein